MGLPDDDALSLSASSMSGLEEDDDDEVSGQRSSRSRWDFSAADAALLVKIVKIAQKRHIKGKHGVWKEYLVTFLRHAERLTRSSG